MYTLPKLTPQGQGHISPPPTSSRQQDPERKASSTGPSDVRGKKNQLKVVLQMVNGRLECREIQEKHLLQVWLDPGSPVLPLGFPLWSSLLSWLFFSDKILRVAPKMAPRPWYLPRYRNSEGERPSFPTPVSIPFREFSLIPLDSCSHWSRDHWWQWPI